MTKHNLCNRQNVKMEEEQTKTLSFVAASQPSIVTRRVANQL